MKLLLSSLKICIPFALLLIIIGCEGKNPNLNKVGEDVLKAQEIFVEDLELKFKDTVYVPIYSDIYSETKDVRFKLTATLSLRNTSLSDSIYIEDIDYYDSAGNKGLCCKHYK
ncbi:MAG: DUF3124 domain-containing protein [Bacteroidia bacterium]|nr:DUF3124 domain-containing protein [Bacteroidia bacterium]